MDKQKAIIEDRGNGIACAGDYVPGEDGNLYVVDTIDSVLQTQQYQANYVYATVHIVDWSACTEDEESTGMVCFPD
jgi:hypothetical protein